MAEYIDRKALRDALYDADAITMNGVKILNQFPAADVAPVRHGQWIIVDTEKGKGVCSNCNRQDSIDPLATHCRFCGARMDLEVMDNGQK